MYAKQWYGVCTQYRRKVVGWNIEGKTVMHSNNGLYMRKWSASGIINRMMICIAFPFFVDDGYDA